jgi:TetR/AcrR family transcriptional regulator, regulator of cefoperazone and chloramphenicol sensitivity
VPKSTREKILDAAEKRFAEHGFHGASMREILREAGANSASGHYHFGSKDAIYRAVIERWLVDVCAERQRSFDRIVFKSDASREEQLRAVITAYIGPHLALCSKKSAHSYMRMIVRFSVEPTEVVAPIYAEIIHPVRKRFIALLSELLPSIDPDDVRRMMGWIGMLMSLAPFDSNYESMAGRKALPQDPKQLIERVALMAAGGLIAADNQARAGREDDSAVA